MAKSKIKYCKDCDKRLNKNAYYQNTIRCKKCNGSLLRKIYYCKDCGKVISTSKTIRCRKCYGKTKIGVNLPKCIDCDKQLTTYHNQRCRKCSNVARRGIKRTLKEKQAISKANKGKNNGQFKTGQYRKQKRYCKHCRRLLKTKDTKVNYCQLCANKIVAKTRTIWHKHHLYLKKFKTDKVIIMRNTKHQSFHLKVYDYLLETQGKTAIRKYLKWFIQKYGVN
jgi:hypothetical protein